MHVKYDVSISYGAKVMAKVMTGQKVDAPEFHSGGGYKNHIGFHISTYNERPQIYPAMHRTSQKTSQYWYLSMLFIYGNERRRRIIAAFVLPVRKQVDLTISGKTVCVQRFYGNWSQILWKRKS